jgi:2-isopropylmalate synthase
MELMLVNLRLMGLIDNDLTYLRAYCERVAKVTHTTIPPNYPVFGRDAFRTGTGVHAAAIIKALNKHDRHLADAVYSGVPAHLVGLEQIVEIGPMSGKSNVLYWLARHKIPATDELVNRIFDAAKQSSRMLTEEELRSLCAAPGVPAV